MDASKKYRLEYRLLHAITNGCPWYGNWGYEFGTGSFALTMDAYCKAVDTLSNMPLILFLSQARKPRTRLQDVISFYKSMSGCELETTRDLFCFLTRLIHDAHIRSSALGPSSKNPGSCDSRVLCAWTVDDIEHVEQAMIKVLRAVGGFHWVTWRALRGAIIKMASPELLDYCLKELGGKMVSDGMVVRSRYNPETCVIEFRLEPQIAMSNSITVNSSLHSNCFSEDYLLRDLKFLFDSLLNPQTMVSYRPRTKRQLTHSSAAKLLDCKQFVKDYKSDKMAITNPFIIRLSCLVELVDHTNNCTVPPPELIILPINATIADLKDEATKAFKEVYVLFKRFLAEELLDYGCVNDLTHIKLLVGLSGSVQIRGRCLRKHGLHLFRMERGTESWTVDCTCGAKDDDGERMLACDGCGVWQHTRCTGIDDFAAVPKRYTCWRCKGIQPMGSPSLSKAGGCRKDEIVIAVNFGFGNSPTMVFNVS